MRRTAVALCLLLLLSVIPTTGLAQRRHHKKPKSAHSLNNKLAAVRNQRARMQRELRSTKHQANVVQVDIHKVDQWLSDVQEQLSETTDHLDESRQQQRVLGKKLSEAQGHLDQTRTQMRRRLRTMYTRGNGSYLTVLANGGNVGDVASRAFLFERIAKGDRNLFERFVRYRKEVVDRKRQQDALVRRISRLAATQRQQQANLGEAKAEKKAALSSLYSKADKLKGAIAQFDRDESQIQSEIVEYMRRARAEALAAAKRRREHPGTATHTPEPIELRHFTGRFSRPSAGRITSRFGMRYHPLLHYTRMHTGCDFGAPYGSPICAAADGVVIHASYMRGYGNTVIIEHGGGISTVYGHASRLYVRSGQSVRRGQRIAAVGSTGLSTGPHLHFEVRVNGRPVNPLSRL